MGRSAIISAALLFLTALTSFAAEPTSAERGYKALTETAFIPGFWSPKSVPNAWREWGVKEKPADYDSSLITRQS